MRKFITVFLLSCSTSALATENNFIVDKINNSCSNWGQSISFRFKDNSVERKTINITISEFKLNIEEKKFYFSDFSKSGTMSLCQLKYDNVFCENQDGYISLNKPYKLFKTGDIVQGEVFVKSSTPIKFNFTYTIPDISKSKPLVCRRY